MDLQEFKDLLRKEAFPDSETLPKGHCLNCREWAHDVMKGYNPARFYSDAGMREFHISGMCEVCFDAICSDDE